MQKGFALSLTKSTANTKQDHPPKSTANTKQGDHPHWICICGVHNHESRKECLGCGKKK